MTQDDPLAVFNPRANATKKYGVRCHVRCIGMSMRSIILQIAVATLAAAPAFAHHGTEAYDLTKTITSTAVATGITWANPHCLLNFDTTDAAGHSSACRKTRRIFKR